MPRSLVSLADFGGADELVAQIAAVRRKAPWPAPTKEITLRLHTTPLALGGPPADWLAALERAGFSLAPEAASTTTAPVLELVYGAHFAPRRRVDDTRATRWPRLAREDPLTRSNATTARLNLGGVVHDPLGALAFLAGVSTVAELRSRPVALIWSGASATANGADDAAPAPVAWVHSLLEGLALLGPSHLLVAQPEGFELYAAVLAAAERCALARHGLRLEAAYTAEQTRHWVASHEGAVALPVPWYPLRHYDDLDAGNAAARHATPQAWRDAATTAAAETLTSGDKFDNEDARCTALAATLAWCLRHTDDV